jgi:hypothetical protein
LNSKGVAMNAPSPWADGTDGRGTEDRFPYAAFASYAARRDVRVVRDIEDFLEGLGADRAIEECCRRRLRGLPRRQRLHPAPASSR